MAKNLIIGGFGYIGVHLARQLIKQGEEVAVFDIIPAPLSAADITPTIAALRGDMTEWPQVMEAVSRVQPDTIFLLATILPPPSEQNLHLTYRVNVEGTVNVLEAIRLRGEGCVVFPSSIAAYSNIVPEVIANDRIQNPQNMYGTTKVCAELIGERYHRVHNVNFRAVRFPVVIGPGRTLGTPTYSTFSCITIEAAAEKVPYSMYVKPETTMPCVYVKDAVKSLIGLRDTDEKKLSQRTYNIHGFTASAAELVSEIKKELPEAKLDYKPNEQVVKIINGFPLRLDDSLARRDWGWQPGYQVEEMVKDYLNELRSHPEMYLSKMRKT